MVPLSIDEDFLSLQLEPIARLSAKRPAMPTPLQLPFPPLVCIDGDTVLDSATLLAKASHRLKKGISICIRCKEGHPKRGGYFFHVKQAGDLFTLYDFLSEPVAQMNDIDELLRFINHASGRQYDEKMWERSQKMNLRSDSPRLSS